MEKTFDIKTFNNTGYIISQLSEETLIPIKKEIAEIKNNFKEAKHHNKFLAGNIEKEYTLSAESKKTLAELLDPFLFEFMESFNYYVKMNWLTRNVPFILVDAWVNFQKKYEFNPNHSHEGVFSFVLWINIPYTIEQEKAKSPGQYGNSNVSGNFQFSYLDSRGDICQDNIPVDKTFENKFIVFPSWMTHCVYPFYSSDEYRISVSGNFKLDVN